MQETGNKKTMHTLSLVDEAFDINSTSEYYLSIRISTNGFSFVVGDPVQKKTLVLFHQDLFINNSEIFLDKLKAVYSEMEMIRLPYKKTGIFYSIPEKTFLIPNEFHTEEKANEIYSFQSEKSFNEKIILSESPFFDNFIVFSIPESIFIFLKYKYPDTEIINDLVLTGIPQNKEESTFHVFISRQSIEILLIEKGHIKFYNTFPYRNNNDILYSVIGSVRAMDKHPDIVYTDGYINKESDIFKLLSSYFKKVYISDDTKDKFTHLYTGTNDARFNRLYNSFSCE